MRQIITSKKTLKYFISEDYRVNGYSPKKRFLGFLCGGDVFSYLKNLRKLEYAKNTNKKISYFFRRLIHLRKVKKFGVDISTNCFGPGLKIEHLNAIVVNKNAIIGKNCVLHQFVTIGNNGYNNSCPTIGDNCYIGSNSSLIGKISIGNNVTIGAGSVVVHSFGSNVTLCGVPAKVVKSNNKL